MGRGIAAAWLAGEAIVAWRMVHRTHRPPPPGALLGITALFAAGALVAEVWPRSAGLVTVTLVGLDVAALLNALPAGLGGQVAQADRQAAKAEGIGTGPNPQMA